MESLFNLLAHLDLISKSCRKCVCPLTQKPLAAEGGLCLSFSAENMGSACFRRRSEVKTVNLSLCHQLTENTADERAENTISLHFIYYYLDFLIF